MNEGEDGRIGGDAQRQRQYRDETERGRFSQCTGGEPQIPGQFIERPPAPLFATCFSDESGVAEPPTGAIHGIMSLKPVCAAPGGAHFEMEPHLLLQVFAQTAPAQKEEKAPPRLAQRHGLPPT